MSELDLLLQEYDQADPNRDKWDYDIESIDPSKLLADPRFLADLRRLYEIEGGKFDSDEDMVNDWYRGQAGADVNLVMAGRLAAETIGDDVETKRIKSRLARARQHMPNPWEEGSPGWWEWSKGYVGHAAWDPTNFIPVAWGVKGVRTAALLGQVTKGQIARSAVGKEVAKKAAITEGTISGGQEAGLEALRQQRDISIGRQDGFSVGRLAAHTGIGFVAGSGIGYAIAQGATWFVGRRALMNIDKLKKLGWHEEDIAKLGEKEFKHAWKTGQTAPHVERTPEGETIDIFPGDPSHAEGVPSGRALNPDELEALGREPHYGRTTSVDERLTPEGEQVDVAVNEELRLAEQAEVARAAGVEVPAPVDNAGERILADQQRQLEEHLVSLRADKEGKLSDPESGLWDQIEAAAVELANVRKLRNWRARIEREQVEIDELLASNDPGKIATGRRRAIDNAKTRAEYDTLIDRVIRDPSELEKLDAETISALEASGEPLATRSFPEGQDQPDMVQPGDDGGTVIDAGFREGGKDLDPTGEATGADAAARDAKGEEVPDTSGEAADADTGTTETTTPETTTTETKGGRPPIVLTPEQRSALSDAGISNAQMDGDPTTGTKKVRPSRLAAVLANKAGIDTKNADGSKKSTQEILNEWDDYNTTVTEDASSVAAGDAPVGEAPVVHIDDEVSVALAELSEIITASNPELFLDKGIVFTHIETNGRSKEVQDLMKDKWLAMMDTEPTSKSYLEGLSEADAKWIEREVNKRWKEMEKNASQMLMAHPAMREMYGSLEGFYAKARPNLERQVRADFLEGRIGPRKRQTGATQRAIDKVEGTLGQRTEEQISDAERIAESFRIAREARDKSQLARAFKPKDIDEAPTTGESIEGELQVRAYADLTGTQAPIKYKALGSEELADTKRVDAESVDARREREDALAEAEALAFSGRTKAQRAAAANKAIELKEEGERIWKKAYASRGKEVWFDPVTQKTYSNRNNINVAHKSVDDVDLGPKVTAQEAHSAARNRRRIELAQKLAAVKQRGARGTEAEEMDGWQRELDHLDAEVGAEVRARASEDFAEGDQTISDISARAEELKERRRALGEPDDQYYDDLVEAAGSGAAKEEDALLAMNRALYDSDGAEHMISSDPEGYEFTPTGRKKVVDEDGDEVISDAVARTAEEHTDAINKAFSEFQETQNPQAFQDAIRAINEDFALDGTDAALPEPPVKAGVRGQDRIVAIVKRDGDLSEKKNIRVISQKQIDQGKGHRDLLGKSKEEDWIVGSIPRGVSKSDPSFSEKFVPDRPDDAAAVAKIPEGTAGSSHTPLDDFNRQTFELVIGPKGGGRVFTGPFADMFEQINFVSKHKAYGEFFDDAAFKEGKLSITGKNLDQLVVDLGHGYPNSKTGVFANTAGDHADRIQMLETMLEVRRQVAPNGIRRPDEDVKVVTDRLVTEIFSEADEATKGVARDILNRVSLAYKHAPGGTANRAPIVTEGGRGFEFGHNTNEIHVGEIGQGFQPDASRLIHEVGHWSWDNILTDADKIEYLQILSKYYDEAGNLDLTALKGRTIDGDTIKSNALESPGEFFASQLERWATQNVYRNEIGDDHFWKRMINYMKAVFDRYMDGRRIDPDMERLFKKVLPANEARAAAERGPTTRAGTKTGQAVLNRAWALDDIMDRVNATLVGEDMLEQLNSPADLMHYLWSIGGGHMGKNPLNAVSKIKMEIVGASRKLKEALKIPEGLDLERSREVIADIAPDSAEFERRANLVKRLMTEAPEGERSINEVVEDIRRRLAKAFYNAEGEHYRPDNMPESVKKYAYRNSAGEFRAPGASRSNKGKMYAAAKKQQDRRKARVEQDLEKIAKAQRVESPGEAPAPNVSLKKLSDEDLLRLWGENNTGKYGKQIANEYSARVKAMPLPARAVEVSDEVFNTSTKSLLSNARDSWRAGDKKMMDQYLYEYSRRAFNKNNPDKKVNAVRSKVVIDLIRREVADTIGDEADDGIPANARANVREILSHVSNRNPERQLSERRMMYRLLALAGRTQPGAEHENLVTIGDIYRLGRGDAISGFRESPRPHHPDSVFSDYNDPEFKHLRRTVRELSEMLDSGEPDAIQSGVSMIIRSGILSKDDMSSLMREYKPFGKEFDQGAKRMYYKNVGRIADLRSYPEEQEDAAIHWLASDTYALLDNKGSEIADPGLINIQDRVIEGLAYLFNGELKNAAMKEQFTMLDAYGDMFMPLRVGGQHPLLDVIGRRTAIPSEYSVDYVGQLLESMHPDRFDAMMSFIGRGIGRSRGGAPLIHWHGTASGSIEANPDFTVHLSAADAQYGPGFYVASGPNARKAAAIYSTGSASPRSYEFRISDAIKRGTLTEEQGAELLGVSMDMLESRRMIKLNNTWIREVKRGEYSEGHPWIETRFEPADEEAVRIAQYTSNIRNARDVERFATQVLQENGIGDEPHVIPMVIRLNNPADFRTNISYDSASPLILEINKIGGASGALDSHALRMLNSQLSEPKDGVATYKALVKAFAANENSLGTPNAKQRLAQFLEDEMDFDGMMFTHGISEEDGLPKHFDGALVWNKNQVKAITAKEFDPSSDHFSQSVLRPRGDVVDGVSPNGVLMSAHIANARAGNKGANFAPMGTVLEEGGVPPRTVDAMRNMLKGKKATDTDLREVRKFSPMLQLRTNSARMRAWGADWFADWVSPIDGHGFYETHHVSLAGKIMPIIKSLNKISSGHGSKGAMARWMSRSNPLSRNMSAAEENITRALRRAPGNSYEKKLSAEGQATLADIRAMFANEIREMEKAGIITGKIENYFPQIWSVEKIQANMDSFKTRMAQYFVHEANDRGEKMDMGNAVIRADGMIENLLSEDGINLPPVGGGSRDKVTDHIDYQRLIRLDQYPEMLEALEPFLESNLRDVLVKYLDGTTSRMVFHNKFGVKNHGFYAYKKVIQEGESGIADLLSSDSIKLRPIKGRIGGEGVIEHANFKHRIIKAPYSSDRRQEAEAAAAEVLRLYRDRGKLAARRYLEDLVEEPNPEWSKRAEAISEGVRIVNDDAVIHAGELDHMEGTFNALQRKPVDGGSRFFESQHKFSKAARNFTAVTLLGWTALTSTTDPVLPMIRSGSMKAWYRGIRDWAKNPNYRDMIRESGIAIENLVHERLVHQYGVDGSKLATSFFNATMLTPWTQMQREWAGLIGFNWLKAEQKNYWQYGKEHRLGKKAFRILKSYGLDHLTRDGAYQLDTPADIGKDDALKMGLIKFSNQSIYTPNPNDIPLWAQTPIGAMMFQLKSFPMMMGRMVGGRNETRGIIQEAFSKKDGARNVTPLLYFLAIAPWFGAGSLASKDYAQMRGGEDQRSSALRDRRLSKNLEHLGVDDITIDEIADLLGYNPDLHPDRDAWLGHYVEGFGHLGGLSLVGELMHSAAANADNGAYGLNRMMSMVMGPSFGHLIGFGTAFQGLHSTLVGDETTGERRAGVREVAARIPVLGGVRAFREGITDMIAGQPTKKSGGSSSGWGSSWSNSW